MRDSELTYFASLGAPLSFAVVRHVQRLSSRRRPCSAGPVTTWLSASLACPMSARVRSSTSCPDAVRSTSVRSLESAQLTRLIAPQTSERLPTSPSAPRSLDSSFDTAHLSFSLSSATIEPEEARVSVPDGE